MQIKERWVDLHDSREGSVGKVPGFEARVATSPLPPRSKQFFGQPSLLYNEYRELFLRRDEAAGAWSKPLIVG
jgi:hypothetical protein